MDTKSNIAEIIGWYGAMAILLAFGLVSFEVLEPISFWYQFLNFTGAMGIAYISFKKQSYQPGVLNLVWTIIAFIAIMKMFLE